MQVLIYQDYINNNGALFRALGDHFGKNNVGFVDAHDIHDGALNAEVRLLVMPGGADLFYCEKLNGAGNKAIHRWVADGGTYLGICAGAYYACAALGWAEDTAQEISGVRELALFGGRAVGPIAEFIEGGDAHKSWNAAVNVIGDDGVKTIAHYNGGPLFEGNPETVLARYADLPGQPAAAIECKVGKGNAILCSFHVESSPESYAAGLYSHQNKSWEHNCRVASLLTPHGAGMSALRERIFDRAGLTAKRIAA